MQGVFIDSRRPKSLKEVKETVKTAPERVSLEATSLHGGDYQGFIKEMPEGRKISFVGPDPHTNRKFYGSITRTGDKFKVE